MPTSHYRTIGGRRISTLTIIIAFELLLGLLLMPEVAPTKMSAAPLGCSISGPLGGTYSVTLCIVNPTDGQTISRAQVVSASLTFTGSSRPGVSQLVFSMTNQYLLTFFAGPPYLFTLPSQQFADVNNTALVVQASFSDGFSTPPASINISLNNGVNQPPSSPNTWQIAPGTEPPSGQPFTIAAVGDGAGGEINAANVTSLIAAQNPNMFLYLGDVYEDGSIAEFYNYYEPSSFFGRFRSITNPTAGNHEYLQNSTSITVPAGYAYYWGNGTPYYYSFDVAGWHVLSLSTNCLYLGGCNVGQPEYSFVQQDLQANASACKIAFYHDPLYDIGPEGASPPTGFTPIWQLLAQNHVALVLNGHSHNYQRWVPLDANGNPSPKGVTEFVLGMGGHSVQPFITSNSNVVVGYDSSSPTTVYGSLFLSLYPDRVSFSYLNTSRQMLDSGTVMCGGGMAPAVKMFLPAIMKP